MTGCAKSIPDPTSCQDGHYDLSVSVGDFITDSAFSCAFSHNPTTFVSDPRVIGSVTGWAPVEHLHNHRMHPVDTNTCINFKIFNIKRFTN